MAPCIRFGYSIYNVVEPGPRCVHTGHNYVLVKTRTRTRTSTIRRVPVQRGDGRYATTLFFLRQDPCRAESQIMPCFANIPYLYIRSTDHHVYVFRGMFYSPLSLGPRVSRHTNGVVRHLRVQQRPLRGQLTLPAPWSTARSCEGPVPRLRSCQPATALATGLSTPARLLCTQKSAPTSRQLHRPARARRAPLTSKPLSRRRAGRRGRLASSSPSGIR